MSDAPWLTIVGMGAHGVDALPGPSQAALALAEVVIGPARHLDLVGPLAAETIVWPTPFADGLPILQGLRGRRVVALVSGDPFWFGAGRAIADALGPGDWTALPAPPTFSHAAAALGWPLERTLCLGLHAAPLARLRPDLAPGVRCILLLRDGAAVAELAAYLTAEGFGESRVHVLERLGGPSARTHVARADALSGRFAHPVCAGVEVRGGGAVLPRAGGLPDAAFDHDGQITKRPIRALTLSALGPRPFERLWDIGGGSGSIAVEWGLSHPAAEAVGVERRPDRAARMRRNIAAYGLDDRIAVVEGSAPAALEGLPRPDAIFVGGGLSEGLLQALSARRGARLVVNAVTLESEALLAGWHARLGGALTRVAISTVAPLGPKRGWQGARPVMQWSVTL